MTSRISGTGLGGKPLVTRSLQVKLQDCSFNKPHNYFITIQLSEEKDGVTPRTDTGPKIRTDVSASTNKPQFTSCMFHLPLSYNADLSRLRITFEAHMMVKAEDGEKPTSQKVGNGAVKVSTVLQALSAGSSVTENVEFFKAEEEDPLGTILLGIKLWQIFGTAREPIHQRFEYDDLKQEPPYKLSVRVMSCLNAPGDLGNSVRVVCGGATILGGQGDTEEETRSLDSRHCVWDEEITLSAPNTDNDLVLVFLSGGGGGAQGQEECKVAVPLSSFQPIHQYSWELVFQNESRTRLHVCVTMCDWDGLYDISPTTEKLTISAQALTRHHLRTDDKVAFIAHITTRYKDYLRKLQLARGLWPSYPFVTSRIATEEAERDITELPRVILHRSYRTSDFGTLGVGGSLRAKKIWPKVSAEAPRPVSGNETPPSMELYPDRAQMQSPGAVLIVEMYTRRFPKPQDLFASFNGMKVEGNPFAAMAGGTGVKEGAKVWSAGDNPLLDDSTETWCFEGHTHVTIENIRKHAMDVVQNLQKTQGPEQMVDEPVFNMRDLHVIPPLNAKEPFSLVARTPNKISTDRMPLLQLQIKYRVSVPPQQTIEYLSYHGPGSPFSVPKKKGKEDDEDDGTDPTQKVPEPVPDWLLQDGLSEEDKLRAIRSCGEEIIELRRLVKRQKEVVFRLRKKAVKLDRLEGQIKSRHQSAIAKLPRHQLTNLVFKYASAYKQQKEDKRLLDLKIQDMNDEFHSVEKLKMKYAEVQGAHLAQGTAMQKLHEKLEKRDEEIKRLTSKSGMSKKLQGYKDTIKSQERLIAKLEEVLEQTQSSAHNKAAAEQLKLLQFSLENQKDMYETDLEEMHINNIKLKAKNKKLESQLGKAKKKGGGGGGGYDSDEISDLSLDSDEGSDNDDGGSSMGGTNISLAPSVSLSQLSRPGSGNSLASTGRSQSSLGF